MAVIYYPKGQLIYVREQQVSSSNYESTWQDITLNRNCVINRQSWSIANPKLMIFRGASGCAKFQTTDYSIYNRILTNQEIIDIFNATRGRFGI